MTIDRVAGWTLLGIHGLTGAVFLAAIAVGAVAMPAEYRYLMPLAVPFLAILAAAWAFCLPAVLRVSRELMAVGQAAPVVAATPAAPKATAPAAAVATRTPERAAQLPVRRLEA
jgi:hypothetical protein